MTKALSYIRFSSDGQADGSSIERQSEIITLYAQRNTLEITETFIDDGYSASKGHHLSRGQLGRILCDIDAGRYHGFALVVEKMDRFSRLGIEETRQLIRRLIKGGVELHLAGSNRVVRSLDDLPTVIMDAVESYGAKAYADNMRVNVQRGIEKLKDKAAEGCVIRAMSQSGYRSWAARTLAIRLSIPAKSWSYLNGRASCAKSTGWPHWASV